MKHKTKSLLKLAAAAAMLFFVGRAVACRRCALSSRPFDCTRCASPKSGEAPLPLILNHIDLPPAAAGDGSVTFSLDLYFGANTAAGVRYHAPLIHYDSNILEVITEITNIAPSPPRQAVTEIHPATSMRGYKQLRGAVARRIKIAGELVTTDTNTLMLLSAGMDGLNEIKQCRRRDRYCTRCASPPSHSDGKPAP